LKRLVRFSFRALALVLLLLMVGTAALWIRSATRVDGFGYRFDVELPHTIIGATSDQGIIRLWRTVGGPEFAGPSRLNLWSSNHDIPVMYDEGEPIWSWGAVRASGGLIHASPYHYRSFMIAIAHWMVVIATAVVPVAALIPRLFRPRRRPDICSNCGYDLRASPDRCPECGLRNTKPQNGEPAPPITGL